jgi:ABC-2 type transport system ATP-binding protein
MNGSPMSDADAPMAVSVRGLTKRYDAQVAVDGLTFDVPAGRVVGFIGPNGAGKSTTLRMIIGLTAPTAGTARILGRPLRDHDDPARAVGSIVDGVGFHPGRRAIDELRLSAHTIGLPRGRCDEVLALVGLAAAARKRVGTYSLGMRQRLGLARALLGDPAVLLLDEPANGLDPEGIHWIRSLLRDLADRGRAVLVSSHLIGEVARVADDVIVIQQGRLVAHAPVAEIMATSGHGSVRVAGRDDAGLAAVLRARGAEVNLDADGLDILGLPADDIGLIAFEAGIPLHELHTKGSELEDAFLTGRDRLRDAAVVCTPQQRSVGGDRGRRPAVVGVRDVDRGTCERRRQPAVACRRRFVVVSVNSDRWLESPRWCRRTTSTVGVGGCSSVAVSHRWRGTASRYVGRARRRGASSIPSA